MSETNSKPLKSVNLKLAYLAEQPIIHTEETIGNISKVKRMRVIYKGQPKSVPALSGNSFRGQFRDILADQMCASLSNQGESKLRFTNNDVYGILYSGGVLGERRSSPNLIHSFSENLPSMRLMGAAFGNVMLPSKIAATHVIPCAKETENILQNMSTGLSIDTFPVQSEWPNANNLVFNDGPLTRKDDSRDLTRQRFAAPNADEGEEQVGSQMIYYVECIPPGTWLLQQVYSKFPLDEHEIGCFFDGLSAFLKAPSLGGRSAAGYGQVRVHIQGQIGETEVKWPDKWPEQIQDAITSYQTYLDEKQDTILETLTVSRENS